jgi:zinc protease
VAVKETFDRSKMPEVGPAPKFTPPGVVRRKLSNGLEVLIAERHELPVLSLELVVKGGETLVPADKHGLAGLTASLLSGGTTTRDAPALASALAEIGSTIKADGKLEATTVGMTTLTKHTDRALDLFTDVLLHPTFPARELERVRALRLAGIQARADSAPGIAMTVYPRVLYGETHPYGRPREGSLKTIAAITRDDVVAFHKRLYTPGNSSLIVAGDTTPDAVTAVLEKALKEWKSGDGSSSAELPEPPPPPKGVTVYLVDKPAAAQSFLMVGEVGVKRKVDDYVPLTVMNAVLGGEFSSRINLNLREDKGYTYGAHSQFVFRLGPGPFYAGGSVQTNVTKEALSELIKELTDVTGPRTITEAELDFAKDRIVRGFPAQFETTGAVAGTLADLVFFDLPDDEFTTYPARVAAVTKADVDRVAGKYLHPDRITILVVGDRSKVEGPLKTLPFARVVNLLDPEGNPLPEPTAGDRDVK